MWRLQQCLQLIGLSESVFDRYWSAENYGGMRNRLGSKKSTLSLDGSQSSSGHEGSGTCWNNWTVGQFRRNPLPAPLGRESTSHAIRCTEKPCRKKGIKERSKNWFAKLLSASLNFAAGVSMEVARTLQHQTSNTLCPM